MPLCVTPVYDIISLGEVMLRLDPGDGRIRTARSFRVFEGGGEYNVARAFKKCFNKNSAVLTAFADNEVGTLLEDLIMQGGVDTRFIKKVPYDGIGAACRNGLNFTERGFGVRGGLGVSDRANTAVSKLTPSDFDFDEIFGSYGTRLFHTGGIFAALSETSAALALEAVKKAKEYGALVSYDLNYRPSLWKTRGIEKAREVNREIVKYVDILLGNEEDFSACLGLDTGDFTRPELTKYDDMLRTAASAYPGISVIATSIRGVKTASCNSWTAKAISGGTVYDAISFPSLEIYDRVGGGDSFASGLLYGILSGFDIKKSLDFGVAHGALTMTTPGDTSAASLAEVERLASGGNARTVR